MNWTTVTLGEICDLVNGKAYNAQDWATEGVPIIRIQNLNGVDKPFNYWSGPLDREVQVKDGDILLAWSGTPGTSFGAHTWRRGCGVLNQHIFRLDIDRKRITGDWAVTCINHQLHRLIGQAHGGVGLQHVTKPMVQGLKIPLPPLPEQRRIAAILDKADAIRRKREEGIRLTEELLRSTFLEMFGDPATNPKGWAIKPFGELARNEDGRRKPVKEADRAERHGEYPYYGASGIIDYVDEFLFNERTLLIAEDGANLLARATPIAFIADGKYWVNNHAHVVSDNGKADLDYLRFSLNLRRLDDFVTGSAQPKLNQASLNRISIPVPPLPAQRKFAEVVRKLNELRKRRQTAVNEATSLFGSLVQRSFRGEL
jgi:type I restriction enzyme S subunit